MDRRSTERHQLLSFRDSRPCSCGDGTRALFARHAQFKFPLSTEHVSQLRVAASDALFRIILRLNPAETTHNELLNHLREAQTRFEAIEIHSPNVTETLEAVQAAAEFTRPVLKTEWQRVKAGEPAFRRLRFWLLPVIVLLALSLAAFIAFAPFRY
jgi:hypothetical protein